VSDVESLKVFIEEVDPDKSAVPGAVIAIQSFGDFFGLIRIIRLRYRYFKNKI